MNEHDIGGRIRHAREQRGMSLGDAAKLTKLSLPVLRAIERNDFTSLPDGLYRKAYLRTLAAEVGLDPNAIAAEYQAAHETPAPPPPVLADRDSSMRWPTSLGTLALFAALAAAWFGLQPDPLPARAAVDAIADASPELRTPPQGERAVAIPRAGETDALVATISERPAAPLRIDIVATDWCWIDAESDGEQTIYRLVSPGEHIRLEGRRGIALRLGNAGSVMMSINEGVSHSPGRIGEVVDIVVTPDNVDSLRDNALETAAAARHVAVRARRAAATTARIGAGPASTPVPQSQS